METIMKSEIFFFITSIAVVILTILIGIIAAYLIRILRNVDDISQKAKNEAALIKEDVADLRQNIRDEGIKVKSFVSFFNKLKGRKNKK
jgi:MFS superfamily sulfate permease-like transporter